MTRLLHCITGLAGDGAQRMLLRLVGGLATSGFNNAVLSLSQREPLALEFETLGVSVTSLGMKGGLRTLHDFVRLRSEIHRLQPDIIQSWMYHANMAVSVSHVTAGIAPLVWNVRRGLDDFSELKLPTRCLVYASRFLARTTSRIIYCNGRSATQHEGVGYPRDRRVVIENGFDTGRFHPNAEWRNDLRTKLHIPEEVVVVGNVGRYNVAKGHDLLIEAFARSVCSSPHCRLMLAGRDVDESNRTLVELIKRLGLTSRVYLLGERKDVERIYPAFDMYCSASLAEGFPNAVAEAMASGVPCVVTDTGASRELVQSLGLVVPTRELDPLSAAISDMMSRSSREREEIGLRGRDRIIHTYSLPRIVEQYTALYREILGRPPLMEAA